MLPMKILKARSTGDLGVLYGKLAEDFRARATVGRLLSQESVHQGKVLAVNDSKVNRAIQPA